MSVKKVFSVLVLFILTLFFAFVTNQYTPVSNASQTNLSKFFKDTKGAFVLTDIKTNKYIRYNEERCQQRFSPHSTFKIPNSLIALETGVVNNENVITPYDREQHPPKAWWPSKWQRDQNMRSAIKDSVVWYYQEIAKKVGKEKYKKYLQQFNYGNQDISGAIDKFWLGSSLQISPNEEVEFLKKFYNGKLPVSKRTTDIVKDILVLEKNNDYKFSGKTGLGLPDNNGNTPTLGWFVGYLEKADNVYFFATNIEGDEKTVSQKRIPMTKQILTELGIL